MNYEKLAECMQDKGVTISDICKELGISWSAFYRKTHGLSEFTRKEIQHIVDYLQLESPIEIFFAQKVS